MDWKNKGGTIINKSSRELIVAMDTTESGTGAEGWGYMTLSPNTKTGVNIDADGFRVRGEGIKIAYKNPASARLGWWRIRNGMLATVRDGKDGQGKDCVIFEVELKNPGSAVIGFGGGPITLLLNRDAYFAVGSTFFGPQPKTDGDFDWNGKNLLSAEVSEPAS